MSERETDNVPAEASSLAGFLGDTAVFEFRYEPRLSLWDRAGELWTDVSAIWADRPAIDAQPNMQAFVFGDYQVRVELHQASVTQRFPDASMGDFAERCDAVMAAVVEHLEVRLLKRVGFRVALFRPFRDKPAALAALRRTGLFSKPAVSFNVHDEDVGLERVVVLEGQSRGVRLHVKAEERKLEITPPFAGSCPPAKRNSSSTFGRMTPASTIQADFSNVTGWRAAKHIPKALLPRS